ncbi:hypothetical protein N9H63_01100 [bacterium]|jgi:hypothetical protein|nr:hypothetical protein [bacterium]
MMLDLIWLLLTGIAAATAGAIIVEVFRYGANLERRNKRTDLWGRPNNHMKDDMD